MSTRIVDDIFYAERLVRFSYCDPAGIVFYPQYFVMFNGLVEDWFNQGLGVNYANYITKERHGLPIVNLGCDFITPSRIGEMITLGLKLDELGRSSMKFQVTCSYKGDVRVKARMVLVNMDLDKERAAPLPDALRALMTAFREGKLDTSRYNDDG